jgi:hypothetical protein
MYQALCLRILLITAACMHQHLSAGMQCTYNQGSSAGQLTVGHKLHCAMLAVPGDEVVPKPHDWHVSRLSPGEKVPAGQMVQAAVEPGDTVP